MTQKEFNEMPAVLTPGHMREVTGLDSDGLKDLRESNPQIVLRKCGQPGGRGRFLYRKADVAKLVGLRYE